MSSSAHSALLAATVAALTAGCSADVLIELGIEDDPEGRPSGFSCVDDTGARILDAPWDLPVPPVLVVEVIRFYSGPPASARLSDIRATCATEATSPIDVRPCIVERRACLRLGRRVGREGPRRYFTRQLAARTGENFILEGIDTAMFRVIVTTQHGDLCPGGDYARPAGDAPAAPPPLVTEGGVVLGCAYSEPLTLDHDQRAGVALDAPSPCTRRDLDQCVELVPMGGP